MRITTGNWLYNAGIVGFLRIMREKGTDISNFVGAGSIDLTGEMLKDFEKAYLKYVIRHGMSPFQVLYEYDKKGKPQKNKKIADLFGSNKDILKKLVQTYTNKLLDIITFQDDPATMDKNSGTLIDSFFCEIAKALDDNKKELLKLSETDTEKEILKNIKAEIKKIESIELKKVKQATKEAAQKYYYLYVYLQPFYKNRKIIGQAEYKGADNRIDGFKDIYVNKAKEAIENKITDGIVCRFCNHNKVSKTIKDDSEKAAILFNETFFSIVGVSPKDFSNFFYNGIPDLFMCDVCKLILLCSFAGLNKKPYQLATSDKTDHIFVNMPSLELLLKENDALQGFYDNYSSDVKDTVYEHIFKDILLVSKIKESRWALQNIFFVEFKPSPQKNTGKPIFKYVHVGKDIAELFSDHRIVNSLRNVNGILILQKKVKGPLNFQKDIWVNIKSDAIKRLMDNDSLYPLVYENLRGILNNGNGNPYNSLILAFVQVAKNQLNLSYAKGGTTMDSKQVYGILAHQFFNRGKEDFNDPREWPIDKKQRLSYRLLSLIRMGKYAEFYESLMKLYINSGKPMPESFLGILNTHDTIDFEAKAYAFMTGFLQDSSQSAQLLNNNKEGQDE